MEGLGWSLFSSPLRLSPKMSSSCDGFWDLVVVVGEVDQLLSGVLG